ncbi:MAG: hypothetical protein NTAFB01_26440 [Nitrospira sp.]
MDVGEAVTASEFVDEDHNEQTCPWHQQSEKKKKKMEPVDPDDDSEAMAPNDGGTLGKNMTAGKEKPPRADTVTINYAPGEELEYTQGKKRELKTIQTYEKMKKSKKYEYDLQYAPHHLIPGNESLKGSPIVPFMGDDDSIAEYAKGQGSLIKEGFSILYDVNNADNGVWLPSPYALSMKNEWPAKPGIKVIKRRLGEDVADETEDFKTAYVSESIRVSGRQFHMRHKGYSDKVREILKTIAQRLKLMATDECPIAMTSEDDGKFNPPMGLVGRLNVLSANLKGLLVGGLWRPPLYTDAMTEEYAADLKDVERKGKIRKVV